MQNVPRASGVREQRFHLSVQLMVAPACQVKISAPLGGILQSTGCFEDTLFQCASVSHRVESFWTPRALARL